MRAITLWEPWASLWCAGVKVHETRDWSTSHRGPIAVHAAKRWDGHLRGILYSGELQPAINGDPRLVRRFTKEGKRSWQVVPDSLGCIVGVVVMDACISTDLQKPIHMYDEISGDWAPGRFAWRAHSPLLLPEPIPCRGYQSIWTVPEDVQAQLDALGVAA